MKLPGPRASKAWTLVAIAGVLVLVCVAFLIRIPEPRAPAPVAAVPSVGFVDPVVTMGTLLRDPTPLFLPTDFNSSRKDYTPREPVGSFAGFDPKFAFADAELVLGLPPAATVPSSPAEALSGDPPGAPYMGFDRSDVVVEPVSPRIAYVDIVNAESGRSVFAAPITDAHPPPASVPWQPMEFIAAVDAAGLVGPVVPTARSGVDDVDAYFSVYLSETLRVGQRLAPGFYRISVGP
jgi:hypothetical protein